MYIKWPRLSGTRRVTSVSIPLLCCSLFWLLALVLLSLVLLLLFHYHYHYYHLYYHYRYYYHY